MTRRIYFLQRADGTGPIKIGCSGWPDLRRRQLQSDLKADLVILAQAPGGYTTERNLHHKFRATHKTPEGMPKRAYSVAGPTEWFSPTPELLAFVEDVAVSGAIPLAAGEVLAGIFVKRFTAGETLRAIARDYGLSHERIRQVLQEQGCPTNRGGPHGRTPASKAA
jgi:hypothetical protein